MTETAQEGGAGWTVECMQFHLCCRDGKFIGSSSGRKTFITGADGAGMGIVMAKGAEGACMFRWTFPISHAVLKRVWIRSTVSMPVGMRGSQSDNLGCLQTDVG